MCDMITLETANLTSWQHEVIRVLQARVALSSSDALHDPLDFITVLGVSHPDAFSVVPVHCSKTRAQADIDLAVNGGDQPGAGLHDTMERIWRVVSGLAMPKTTQAALEAALLRLLESETIPDEQQSAAHDGTMPHGARDKQGSASSCAPSVVPDGPGLHRAAPQPELPPDSFTQASPEPDRELTIALQQMESSYRPLKVETDGRTVRVVDTIRVTESAVPSAAPSVASNSSAAASQRATVTSATGAMCTPMGRRTRGTRTVSSVGGRSQHAFEINGKWCAATRSAGTRLLVLGHALVSCAQGPA
jgi:hypothetical protein